MLKHMVQAAPISPCMNVCVLDADRCCTGCGRTVGEIARWGEFVRTAGARVE